MGCRPELPESVCDAAADVRDEHGYGSLKEAIRHVFREQGHDV